MSKTLSYTELTVRRAGPTRSVGRRGDSSGRRADTRASRAWKAAAAVDAMWDSLVAQHLDAHTRKSYRALYSLRARTSGRSASFAIEAMLCSWIASIAVPAMNQLFAMLTITSGF